MQRLHPLATRSESSRGLLWDAALHASVSGTVQRSWQWKTLRTVLFKDNFPDSYIIPCLHFSQCFFFFFFYFCLNLYRNKREISISWKKTTHQGTEDPKGFIICPLYLAPITWVECKLMCKHTSPVLCIFMGLHRFHQITYVFILRKPEQISFYWHHCQFLLASLLFHLENCPEPPSLLSLCKHIHKTLLLINFPINAAGNIKSKPNQVFQQELRKIHFKLQKHPVLLQFLPHMLDSALPVFRGAHCEHQVLQTSTSLSSLPFALKGMREGTALQRTGKRGVDFLCPCTPLPVPVLPPTALTPLRRKHQKEKSKCGGFVCFKITECCSAILCLKWRWCY